MLLLTCFCAVAFAKDAQMITLQVVNSRASQRQFSTYAPGTTATTSTKCDTSDTGTNASTNCTTTTTPGTPPRQENHTVAQNHVLAILPNGQHITLWCQAGLRRCASLQPGNYQAEVKGNTAWVVIHELDGKERRVKYRSVGGW